MKKLLALCLLFVSGMVAIADHLPAKLQARGKPENTLAGINLERDTPDEVRRKFGPPTKTIKAPNNPGWTGYLWQTADTRLEVEVTKGRTRDYLGGITIVRMNGESSTSVWTTLPPSTGRGLKLGDTLDTLKKLYGNRLQLSKQAPVPADTDPFLSVPGVETAVVQWSPIEFTLNAGFDNQGRIIALRLNPPECYPGGCQ
jgi:hypothetical protein